MCANVSGAEINACIFGRWANLHNIIHHLKMEIQISEDVVWLPMSRGNKKHHKKEKEKKDTDSPLTLWNGFKTAEVQVQVPGEALERLGNDTT